MIQIIGAPYNNDFLNNLQFVGVLLFAEFPSTLVFADEFGNPIIKEWVDCSDDGAVDRYFFFLTEKYLLKNFLSGYISHYDFIKEAVDGLAYFHDVENNKIVERKVLSVNKLPKQYASSTSFFLSEKDVPDVELIKGYFKLNNEVSPNIPHADQIKDIASSKKTETLNLHLNHGYGVGYGTVNTEILGRTLLRFDKFYKDVALDYFEGSNRGAIQMTASKKQELNPFISTEVYGNIAASYSVLLRPKATQFDMFQEVSPGEEITNKIFKLLENSSEVKLLENEYLRHSDFTINSYKEFLKNIYELQLDVELNWYSPISDNLKKQVVNYTSANKYLYNIENLNVETEDQFTIKGKFRAINCDTGHYTFINTDNEQFTGYFDKLVKEASEQINFISIYNIKINRKVIKEPGRVDARLVDTIISFYKEENIL